MLAHAYVREDHVLDEELPLWVPIPALSEIQLALEKAVAEVTGTQGTELKKIMRTGTVASTDNRNWELLPGNQPQRRFSQSRAVALDMESATIAANGFRFRVPYGTLLCVSDKPLHGEIKLPGMANQFYRERVEQHLRIGMAAIDILRQEGVEPAAQPQAAQLCGSGVPVSGRAALRPGRTAPGISRAALGVSASARPSRSCRTQPRRSDSCRQAAPSAPPRCGRRSLQSRQAQAKRRRAARACSTSRPRLSSASAPAGVST